MNVIKAQMSPLITFKCFSDHPPLHLFHPAFCSELESTLFPEYFLKNQGIFPGHILERQGIRGV